MRDRPHLLYSITNVRFFLEPGSTLRPGFKRESFEVGQAGCTAGALLARREAFWQIGMFDPDLPVGCDQDWFARARDAQLPMHSIPEPLLYKRIHNTNLSSDVHTSGKDLLTTVARSRQRCVSVGVSTQRWSRATRQSGVRQLTRFSAEDSQGTVLSTNSIWFGRCCHLA